MSEKLDINTLTDFFINSVDETKPPIWTDEHIFELLDNFDVYPKNKLEKKIDNIINSLQKDYKDYTSNTRTYEILYQNSINASENDRKSWLRSITISNTRREDIKRFIKILEGLKSNE